MKTLIKILLSLFLITSCSSLSQYKGASKETSIVGPGNYSDISTDLKRASVDGLTVQRVSYYAEATPSTEGLIKSYLSEQCQKNLDSKEVCDKNIASALSESKKMSCFQILIGTMSIETAKHTAWKIKIEQPQDKYIEGELKRFKLIPYYVAGLPRPWQNTGEACFKPKIDFLNEFKMHIIPQFGGADAASLLLIWEKPKTTTN